VREQDDVVHLKEGRVDVGLVREDVEASRVELARLEGVEQRGLVDDAAAGCVDEDRAVRTTSRCSW
jgi:hypothetical protein